MKRLVLLFAALLLICSTASADTITALASEVNPEHLVSVSVDAKIISADGQTATLVLLVPERYDPEEVLALQVGDAIYTQGGEVQINSISEDSGYLVFNAGADDELYLFESIDLNYWIMEEDDTIYLELATVNVPVAEKLLFLDDIDPATGETLIQPTVHNKNDLLAMMGSNDDPGFDIRNVTVVFDENGELALVRRHYVPWQ